MKFLHRIFIKNIREPDLETAYVAEYDRFRVVPDVSFKVNYTKTILVWQLNDYAFPRNIFMLRLIS